MTEPQMPEPVPANLTENATAFYHANKASGVATSSINEDGSGHYVLEDGKEFDLSIEEALSLTVPIWDSSAS